VAKDSSLEALGSVSPTQLKVLREALAGRKAIVISGATAAGKTTLLSALLGELQPTERIVSVEDTFELNISNTDWVAMQTRPASIEGDGEVDLRRLIREALRMRPGWLVVGEVRGAEAAELLVALNSGIPAVCTIHANSAKHAITKMLTLPLLSGAAVPLEFVREVLVSTVGVIAHCGFDQNGNRKLLELVRPKDLVF
jgi:pilus assembly protein CpaF